MIAFRAECRSYAEHWLNVQREEFKRLGGVGDWDHPYTTMSFDAEATIAAELLKFAMNGLLYRGSKPVMWSVVERTALAEAEVEYEEIESPAIYVKFPVASYAGEQLDIGPDDDEFLIPHEIEKASIVIWTTTPWTIPGNRAVSFSRDIDYGVYEVTAAPDDNWAKIGDRLIIADNLAEEVFKAARVSDWRRFGHMPSAALEALTLAHPLRGQGYDFDVPLLAGEHVTEDTGTGFVHTAPGHGVEDFEIWEQNRAELEAPQDRYENPLHRRRGRLLHQGGAGLRGQARHRRQGQVRRRQFRGDRRAHRRRRAHRPRPPQARLSAFLALEEAGDLPRHAAMVHRHGQRDRARGARCAPAR